MKKIIIWGINVIVIILTVFLVSCIIRNNANRSNDIKTQKNTVTVKETVQDMDSYETLYIGFPIWYWAAPKNVGYLLWILLV